LVSRDLLPLAANGHLRPCLLAGETTDAVAPTRNGASDDELAARLIQTVRQTRDKHQKGLTSDQVLPTQMVSIGG
jgi:molybdenum cofactor biosynthesis enzyme MoaA